MKRSRYDTERQWQWSTAMNMSHLVELSPEWMQRCAEIGRQFYVRALDKGYKQRDSRTRPEHALANHVQGCRAEAAFCKWAGCPWRPTFRGFGLPDVEALWHIRSRRRHSRGLLLYEKDDPSGIFVLVTGENPFRIWGWMECAHGRRIGDRESAGTLRWEVPAHRLYGMYNLPNLEEVRHRYVQAVAD